MVKNGRISNSEGLVTMTLDRVMPNFTEIEETFLWTDGQTDGNHGWQFETGFIRSTLSKSWPKNI